MQLITCSPSWPGSAPCTITSLLIKLVPHLGRNRCYCMRTRGSIWCECLIKIKLQPQATLIQKDCGELHSSVNSVAQVDLSRVMCTYNLKKDPINDHGSSHHVGSWQSESQKHTKCDKSPPIAEHRCSEGNQPPMYQTTWDGLAVDSNLHGASTARRTTRRFQFHIHTCVTPPP